MEDKIEDPFGEVPVPPSAKEVTPPPEDSKTKGRSNTMASNGKLMDSIPPPAPFPSWPNITRDDQYIPSEEVDFHDLSDLSREINLARVRSYRIKNELGRVRSIATEAESDYKKAYNRALIAISGGAAEQRKARAEIATEHLKDKRDIAEQVVSHVVSLSYTVSRDLDTLKTIADNLRKQLSL